MVAGFVEDSVDVVVLVDDHQRDIAVSAVRDRDRGSLRDIDDCDAVERVAVHPDHRLMINRRRHPVVVDDVHATGVRPQRRKHSVGFCPHEVVDCD